jgi:peptidyl-prolyl cis-trans isomerase SurA
MKKLLALSALIFAALQAWGGMARPAAAQDILRIAAVVNEDVVSMYDLLSRIRLLLVSSNAEDTQEARRRVAPQVLRLLIDEKLQLQEAKRLNLQVSDAEIRQAIELLEQQNNMQRGGLDEYLRRQNLERESLVAQVRAGLAWQKVLARRVRASVQIGDDEIDDVLNRLSASQGTTEYLLAEIFLSVDSPEQEDEVRQTAGGLIQQMVSGTPFAAIARQFSQSASAATGGDIGWVQAGQFDDETAKVIAQLRPGQITPPLRSVAGYYIYLMRNQRTLAAASPEDATLSLLQLVMPVAAGAPEAQVASQAELAKTVQEVVTGCDDFARVAGEMRLPAPVEVNNVKIRELAPNVRNLVSGLKIGQVSAAQKIDPGLLLVMVCKRSDPPMKLPSRDDIADNLMRQRLDLLGRRYLRDLRRAAFVDVRV